MSRAERDTPRHRADTTPAATATAGPTVTAEQAERDPRAVLDRLEGAAEQAPSEEEEPDRYAVQSRRLIYIGIAIGALVIAAVGFISFYTISETNRNSADIDSFRVGQIASGEAGSAVGDLRTSNLLIARRELTRTNDELRRAGLAPVPDPGDRATSIQVTMAVAEGRGALRAIGELQARGVALPGVSVPDPGTDRFPRYPAQ